MSEGLHETALQAALDRAYERNDQLAGIVGRLLGTLGVIKITADSAIEVYGLSNALAEIGTLALEAQEWAEERYQARTDEGGGQ